MTFSDKERIKLKLELGDILICEGGESGRCAVWNGANEEILFQKAIHRARVKNGSTIMPMFVSILLKEIKLNGGLKDYISKSTIEHLTGEKLNLVPIICPPLILQQEFANKIEAIEKQKELIKKSISETETLFNARMDYYFN
jgi:type I restriction enzyme S subunit